MLVTTPALRIFVYNLFATLEILPSSVAVIRLLFNSIALLTANNWIKFSLYCKAVRSLLFILSKEPTTNPSLPNKAALEVASLAVASDSRSPNSPPLPVISFICSLRRTKVFINPSVSNTLSSLAAISLPKTIWSKNKLLRSSFNLSTVGVFSWSSLALFSTKVMSSLFNPFWPTIISAIGSLLSLTPIKLPSWS